MHEAGVAAREVVRQLRAWHEACEDDVVEAFCTRATLDVGAHRAVADEQEGDVVAALLLEAPRGAEGDLEPAGHADGAGEGHDEGPGLEAEALAQRGVGRTWREQAGVHAVGDHVDLLGRHALADHVLAVAFADRDDVVGRIVEGALGLPSAPTMRPSLSAPTRRDGVGPDVADLEHEGCVVSP